MTTTGSILGNGVNNIDQDLASLDSHSSKRTNALSNKLTNVLSTSYTDTEIRDALHLLDLRGVENTEKTRLELRQNAQKEVIDVNAKIVEDFSKVAKQLKRVGALIATLNQTCDDMRAQITAAKQETAPMLEEASVLLTRRVETETKQDLLEAFCQHFLVSEDDLSFLTNSTKPVDERYFEVLSRVKQIHKDCEVLLGYENQRLGLELMEQTTRNLDAGYKKLYNWIQREFKSLDLEDPQISGSIRRSLRALSERPALFQNCLDFFAEARQATLSDAFQRALTDQTLGAAKAIDFSTHDPLRYIGDMLAWVHSATVSEMEALEGLFISDADEISRGLNAGKNSDPWARLRATSGTDVDDNSEQEDLEQDNAFDGHAALNSLISRNMASVTQALSQRIALTVRSLSDPVSTYKAFNVLSFYHDMFSKLIRHTTNTESTNTSLEQNALLSTLDTLRMNTFKHFETIFTEQIASSLDEEASVNLASPAAVQSTLTQLTKIAEVRGPNLDMQEFTNLYTTMIRPLISSCDELADSLPSPSSGSFCNPATLYRFNYLIPIRHTLSSLVASNISFATEPLAAITREISMLSEELQSDMLVSFLRISRLERLSELLSHGSEGTALARRKVLMDNGIEDFSGALDAFLSSALMDAQEELGQLVDKSIAKEALSQAVAGFVHKFGEIVQDLEMLDEEILSERERNREQEAVSGETDGNGAEDGHEDDTESILLRELYSRTVGEVEALLS